MKYILTVLVVVCVLVTGDAYAVCSTPSGDEGNLRYDAVSQKMQYCDGTDWKDLGVPEFTVINAANASGVADGGSDSGCTSCPSGYTLVNTYVESFINDTTDPVIYNIDCYDLAGTLCYAIEGKGGMGGGSGKLRCGGLCQKD